MSILNNFDSAQVKPSAQIIIWAIDTKEYSTYYPR